MHFLSNLIIALIALKKVWYRNKLKVKDNWKKSALFYKKNPLNWTYDKL